MIGWSSSGAYSYSRSSLIFTNRLSALCPPIFFSQVKLAVSLHAANDRERSALLPVNRRFPLSDLMEACREYVDVSGRRMTFEWALIQGENDSAEVGTYQGNTLPLPPHLSRQTSGTTRSPVAIAKGGGGVVLPIVYIK